MPTATSRRNCPPRISNGKRYTSREEAFLRRFTRDVFKRHGRTVDKAWKELYTRFPDRSRAALMRKMLALEQSETGSRKDNSISHQNGSHQVRVVIPGASIEPPSSPLTPVMNRPRTLNRRRLPSPPTSSPPSIIDLTGDEQDSDMDIDTILMRAPNTSRRHAQLQYGFTETEMSSSIASPAPTNEWEPPCTWAASHIATTPGHSPTLSQQRDEADLSLSRDDELLRRVLSIDQRLFDLQNMLASQSLIGSNSSPLSEYLARMKR